MKFDRLNRWLPLLAFCLISSSMLSRLAHAAPITLSGTTDKAPSNNSIFKFAIGDSFTAVMDLDLSKAVGQADLPPGFTGHWMRYAGISGSIEAMIGSVAWSFTPDALVIRDDVIDDAGKVSRPVDSWHLQAAGPQGLLLAIGLWQLNGSAIDNPDLFVPETPDAFGSATWALFAPSFDPKTGQQLPRLDNIASGPIERWAAPLPNLRR
jgi:hypothetical protein